MSDVHTVVGVAVVAIFAIGWIWGVAAAVAKRGPGERYWLWLTAAQLTAGVQAVVGVILLALGYRPTTWLHYVYGLGPILILIVAHALAREGQNVQVGKQALQPWVPFAFGAFICFGLSLRALMTGLGRG